MAKKKPKKAAKKRTKKTKRTSSCKVVKMCGKRRKICRDRKGRITSNKKA